VTPYFSEQQIRSSNGECLPLSGSVAARSVNKEPTRIFADRGPRDPLLARLLRYIESIPLSDFRFVQRFPVAFDHVDMMQHVNNVAYFVWLQSARCDYFQQVLSQPITATSSIIIARHELDYEAPLDYQEKIAVGCRVSRIGRKSLDMAYEVWSESRNLRSAFGQSTAVAYNYTTRQSMEIPQAWREAITKFEVVAPK
jgi:acyl-CoA thioester hydrolase